jgi:hypothetical protein
MKSKVPISQLLRWRLSQAEDEAPSAPPAARLLERARPWWETTPEQFHAWADRLGRIQMAGGTATGGFPVPTLVAFANQEFETCARVSFLNVGNRQLMFCFQLDAMTPPVPEHLEATFVGERAVQPLLSAAATMSADAEYRVDVELSAELADEWKEMKVMDRMPFRLLLRAAAR